MFKRHLVLKLALVALLIVAAVGLVASATAGDSSDPLISLSYLNETVLPSLTAKLESLVGSAKTELAGSFDDTISQFKQSLGSDTLTLSNSISSDSSEYVNVDLESGQSIALQAGCEMLFVSGSGRCSGSLSDTTEGAAVTDGYMAENHLYLCTEAVTVIADSSVQLLVKGSYSVQ